MIIATKSGLGFKHERAHSSAGRQKETCYLTYSPRNFWITVTVMGSIPDCNSSTLNTDSYMLQDSCIPHFSARLWDHSFWDLAFIALGFVLFSFLVKLHFQPFIFSKQFQSVVSAFLPLSPKCLWASITIFSVIYRPLILINKKSIPELYLSTPLVCRT